MREIFCTDLKCVDTTVDENTLDPTCLMHMTRSTGELRANASAMTFLLHVPCATGGLGGCKANWTYYDYPHDLVKLGASNAYTARHGEKPPNPLDVRCSVAVDPLGPVAPPPPSVFPLPRLLMVSLI